MQIRQMRYGAALVGLLVSACGKDSESVAIEDRPDGITAERVGGGIRLQNGTTQPITYVVVNRGWLGLLASCASPNAQCATLAAGAGVKVELDDIYGSAGGYFSEAIVYYWPIAGGRAQEPVREIVVEM